MISFLSLASLWSMQSKVQQNFVVSYAKVKPEALPENLKLLIVEGSLYNAQEVKALKAKCNLVLAYISFTEISKDDASYDAFAPYTMGENETWGSCYINLKNDKALELMKKRASSLLKKGFDGLFLDTMDNVGTWGDLPHLKDEVLYLMKAINKEENPKMWVQNGGLDILPQTHQLTTTVLVESVATDYNFKQKKYQLREQQDFYQRKQQLLKAKKEFKIEILVVEYALKEALKQQIKERLSGLPLSYYVSNIALNQFKD
ncbi:endo alpha-1,4 polygalactosaminidase [Croceivirga sp. JEA036]|uniref:endo alpha-1,4 polygalactosaminidase n=1 Tax=Croceivirga sp. JEA036 TaxID=2721162 RepID=UPI00143A12C1|nr:endo alpha-1,4 polygalactosaminidase [Croceivirga sp. JEA036]NJB36536.1 endo alpha-1,4 polygalactosaminidase [Croceivirga sp. JEA036]